MAPSKKILFIGRMDLDTGYNICEELADSLRLKLTSASSEKNPSQLYVKTDYVFASGYLTIVEAALNRKLIFASYTNPVRRDYLIMHPISRCMVTGQSSSELTKSFLSLSSTQIAEMINSAYHWAKGQTWRRLTAQYEALWQK